MPAKPAEDPAVTNIAKHLQTAVDGNPIPFSDQSILTVSDIDKIRKVYKVPINSKPQGKGQVNGTANSPSEIRKLESILLSSMAIKGS